MDAGQVPDEQRVGHRGQHALGGADQQLVLKLAVAVTFPVRLPNFRAGDFALGISPRSKITIITLNTPRSR